MAEILVEPVTSAICLCVCVGESQEFSVTSKVYLKKNFSTLDPHFMLTLRGH